ncbi:hypothetical protein, partial [Infirmifilum uzonense]|uniref:hypothetical protein n=1 Tax=Infirmifilum uzonense TaxID=1550241 RepID=UPI003C706B38
HNNFHYKSRALFYEAPGRPKPFPPSIISGETPSMSSPPPSPRGGLKSRFEVLLAYLSITSMPSNAFL